MSEAFDNEGFFSALNAERLSRQVTWKDVAAQTGLQASTFSRMSQGKNPDVNGLAELVAWSGLSIDDFILKKSDDGAGALSKAVALLRASPELDKEKSDILVNVLTSAYKALKENQNKESA